MKKILGIVFMLLVATAALTALDVSMNVEGDITLIDENQEMGLWTRYEAIFKGGSGDVDFAMAFGYDSMTAENLFPGALLDWTVRFWMFDDLVTLRAGNLWVNTYRQRSLTNKVGTFNQISGNAMMVEAYPIDGLDVAVVLPFAGVADQRSPVVDTVKRANLYGKYDFVYGIASLGVNLDAVNNRYIIGTSVDVLAVEDLLARLMFQTDMNFGAGTQENKYSVGARYRVPVVPLSVTADWYMTQDFPNEAEAMNIAAHGTALNLSYDVLSNLEVYGGSTLNYVALGADEFEVFNGFLALNAGVEYGFTRDLDVFAKLEYDGDLTYRLGLAWSLSF